MERAFIRVARLGEKVLDLPLTAVENRIKDYFSEELEKGEHEIRVNGEHCSKDTILKNEDVVTLVPNIRAG